MRTAWLDSGLSCLTEVCGLQVPFSYCWSPSVVPKPEDWGPHIDITGYLFLNESKLKEEGYTPPKDLADFLAAGAPPVYIGAQPSVGMTAAHTVCRGWQLFPARRKIHFSVRNASSAGRHITTPCRRYKGLVSWMPRL